MKKHFLSASFAALLLSATLLSAAPAFAHHAPGVPHDVSVKVNGLVCDFCAQALEKVFRKESAVKDIYINLGEGYVDLDFNDGASLDDETIKNLIVDSGYDVKDIERGNL